MPSSTVRECLIPAGEISLHTARAGEQGSPEVILLHGLYDRWESFAPVIDDLAAHLNVYAPDLRGHARSSWPEEGYWVENYAEDLVNLMDSLEIERSIPVGHSLGASVALALATTYPDRVKALVLVDPPLTVGNELRGLLEFLVAAKRVTPEETLEMVKQLGFTSTDEEARVMTQWIRETSEGPALEALQRYDTGGHPDYFDLLRRVTCPTLILQADPESGGVLSDEDAKRARSLLSAVSVQAFKECGHFIHAERPQEFVGAVTEFVRKVA